MQQMEPPQRGSNVLFGQGDQGAYKRNPSSGENAWKETQIPSESRILSGGNMITLSLNEIREQSPCKQGWEKLLKSKQNTHWEEQFPLSDIINSNGLNDALWCLRVRPEHSNLWRKYAVWCARQVEHLMTDKRSKDALDVAWRHSEGQATDEELTDARYAAWAAERAAERVAAELAAERYAAWAAALAAGDAADAARNAAWNAAWDATGYAAWAARAARDARDASRDARDASRDARDAALAAQENKLREILKAGEWA